MKLLVACILIAIGAWIAISWHNTRQNEKYSKPWWTGSEYQKVCNNSGDKCYTLAVYSDGESIEKITFPNGGYLVPSGTSCHKAAEQYTFSQFCEFVDSEGNSWDIIPIIES